MMFDLFWRAQWGELYAFFSRGTPPLMTQLLAINTIFFILFILKRIWGRPSKRAQSSHMVQIILILANMALIYEDQLSPLFHRLHNVM
jgi:hypothetical protein